MARNLNITCFLALCETNRKNDFVLYLETVCYSSHFINCVDFAAQFSVGFDYLDNTWFLFHGFLIAYNKQNMCVKIDIFVKQNQALLLTRN